MFEDAISVNENAHKYIFKKKCKGTMNIKIQDQLTFHKGTLVLRSEQVMERRSYCYQRHLFLFRSVCCDLCMCHPQLSFGTLARTWCCLQSCFHFVLDPSLSFSAPSAQDFLGPCSVALGFSTSLPGTIVSKLSLASPPSEVLLLSFH